MTWRISDWRWEQLHRVAVSGLLACGTEAALAALDRTWLAPTHFYIDLIRPSRAVTTTVRADVTGK